MTECTGKKPMVSLVMKVYNGEKYIKEAIDSILAQTYSDFELLVIDDGSKDSSVELIEAYIDDRIRLIKNKVNLGLIKTQNKVIGEARGKYIAVMDCDDISFPERFEKQVEFLESNPEYIMCGTFRKNIIDGKMQDFVEPYMVDDPAIKYSLCFGNMLFTHSSIMFRKDMYDAAKISYGPAKIAEDYQVITRMAQYGKLGILNEELVAYRIYGESVSQKKKSEMAQAGKEIRTEYVKSLKLDEKITENLVKYFTEGSDAISFDEFAEALSAAAEHFCVDIRGNMGAKKLTTDFVRIYINERHKYDMKLYRSVRKKGYKDVVPFFSLYGLKFFGACLLRYKR